MFRKLLRRADPSHTAYILRNSKAPTAQREVQLAEIQQFAYQPLISVLMTTYNSDLDYLERAIQSVLAQTYTRWQLCIADDASPDPAVQRYLLAWQKREPRVALHLRRENGHMSRASNDGLDLVEGEFTALLDHDDELAPSALYWVVRALQDRRDAQLVYTDEDKVDGFGYRYLPSLKPRWSPDLARTQNYVCHLGVYRSDRMRAIGGFRVGYEGSQDHDLLLRFTRDLPEHQVIHIPQVLYHWRATATSTAGEGVSNKPYALINGRLALMDDAAQEGVGAVDVAYRLGAYRVHRQPILGSGLQAHVVVHGVPSSEFAPQAVAALREHLGGVACVLHVVPDSGPVTVVQDNANAASPPQFSTRENPGLVAYANGLAQTFAEHVIVLIEHGVVPTRTDWLAQICAQCLRPGVGAVTAKLADRQGLVTTAGWHIDGNQCAHAFGSGTSKGTDREFGRLQATYNVDAVDRGLLAIRGQTLLEAGGFDARDSALVADLKLGFKLRSAGKRQVVEGWMYFVDTRAAPSRPPNTLPLETDESLLTAWQAIDDGQRYRHSYFMTQQSQTRYAPS